MERLGNLFEGLGEGLGQRPHDGALCLAVEDGRAGGQTLGAEPQLSGQVLLQHVVGELGAEVAAGPSPGAHRLLHQLAADRQHLRVCVFKTKLILLTTKRATQ